MYPKLYTNIKVGLESWRDLYCATWVKNFLPNVRSDQLICLVVLNFKTTITKVTGVSFGTPKNYMPQNPKTIPLPIRSCKPQLSYNWQDYFPSLFIFKACVCYYFNKAFKKLWKMLFISLNCSFGSYNIQILEENEKFKNGKIMTAWKVFHKLPT